MNTVCHLTSAHPSNDIRIFHKECLSLQKAGYHVVLLVSKNRVITGVEPEGIVIRTVPGLRFRLLRVLVAPWLFFVHALRCRASVYHLHDPELLPAGFLLKAAGRRVLYDAHENTAHQVLNKYYLSGFLKQPAAWLIRWFENLAARFFDGIVASTEGVGLAFPSAQQSKIALVRNYPDPKEFAGITAEGHKGGVCYVGTISRGRGVETIIDSVKYHEADVELAGYQYPAGWLDRLLDHEGPGRVRYLGVVDRRGIRKILERARVGLVVLSPGKNHQLALPVKMFEYMAAGLPVIASNFPLWKSIIEDHECGWCIEPDDPEQLGYTIKRLLNDQELCRHMGENGRRVVMEKYNWINEEKTLMKLYNKILA